MPRLNDMLKSFIEQLEKAEFEFKAENQQKEDLLNELRHRLKMTLSILHAKGTEYYGITQVEIGDILDEIMLGFGRVVSLPDEDGYFKFFWFKENKIMNVCLTHCRRIKSP